MRLGWAVYISPNVSWLVADDVVLLLAAVELLRRFQWAIYRVEWEYVKDRPPPNENSDSTSLAVSHPMHSL